jgi:pyruvate formate lyase activating enzyme
MSGILFDIKRFAVHDGPGIRTTVFFKGCPLSCLWCHNPEGLSPDIVCISKSTHFGDKTFTEVQPVGRLYTKDEVLKELLKEKIFMEESGGGVTFSGGEPTLQSDFLLDLLKSCRSEGIHTAVDTTGFVSWEILERISLYTDLFLFDIKLIENELHEKCTGVSNKLIHENLHKLLENRNQVRIRIPLIPEITFTEKNINETLHFLSGLKHAIAGVDLLPYHNTATHKYVKFGLKNNFKGVKSLNMSDLNEVKQQFLDAGFNVKIGG